MPVLNFDTSDIAPRTGKTPRLFGQPEREKAQLWLNVGIEIDGEFINLPFGLPLDTMQPVELRGQNKEWLSLQQKRNKLLQKLQSMCSQLQAGQEAELPTLQVRARRVMDAVDEAEVASDVDFDSILSFRPTAKPE